MERGRGLSVCVCCETKRNRSTSSSVRQGKEHSRSRSGRSFNFVGDKRVGTSQASAKKRGGFVLYFKKRIIFPELFPFLKRHTHTHKKRAAEKEELGVDWSLPFSIHQLPLFLIEQLWWRRRLETSVKGQALFLPFLPIRRK